MQSPQALLEHASFLRRLAHALVRDSGAADDLVQDTWVAALEQPPREVKTTRAWLAQVLRNRVVSGHRTESRRRARERRTAPREALPSVEDIAEKEAVGRRVATAVFTLDEPYRSTILLRYYEDQSPAVIARDQNVPVETVRTRLKRGLERLRLALDDEFDDRQRWLGALLLLFPFRDAGAVSPPLATGAYMSAKLKAVLIVLFAVGTGTLYWSLDGSNDNPGTETAAKPATPAPEESANDDRSPEVADPAPTSSDTATSSQAVLQGRVVDRITRAPIRGARIYMGRSPRSNNELLKTTTTSDVDGAYRITLAKPGARPARFMSVEARGYVRYRTGIYGSPDEVIELAPGLVVTGVVRGPDREPVGSGRVRVLEAMRISPDHRGSRSYRSDGPLSDGVAISSDGRFEITVTTNRIAFLASSPNCAPGFTDILDVEAQAKNHFVIDLAEGHELSGVVRDTSAKPISGAKIRLWLAPRDVAPDRYFGRRIDVFHTTTTGKRGHFRLRDLTDRIAGVTASHADYRHRASTPLSDLSQPVEFVLQGGQWLVGKLVDELGLIVPPQQARQIAAQEHWTFDVTGSGRFRTHSFNSVASHATLRVQQYLPIEVTWKPGAGAHDVGTLIAKFGRTIHVSVRADDQPISGATVHVNEPGNSSRGGSTDARGQIALSGFADTELDIFICKLGYARWNQRVDPKQQPELAVELTRSTAGRVRGRLVDEEGNPVFGVDVDIKVEFEGRSPTGMRSAPDGRFVVYGVPPQIEGLLRYRFGGSRIDISIAPLEPLEERDVGDIVLQTGRAITGIVVDETGKPVSNAVVTANSNRALTGSDGKFTITGVQEERVVLHAECERYVSVRNRPVQEDDTEPVRLVLQSLQVHSGRIEDEEGQAISGASVAVTSHDSRFAGFHRRSATDERGRYQLEMAPTGEVRMTVSHDGFVQWARLSGGAAAPELIVLSRGAALEVRLSSTSGQMPPKITINFAGQSSSHAVEEWVAVARGLPSGTHELVVRAKSFSEARIAGVVLESGRTAHVEVDLGPKIELAIHVQHHDGTPVVHGNLTLFDDSKSPRHKGSASISCGTVRNLPTTIDAGTIVAVLADGSAPSLFEHAGSQIVDGKLTLTLVRESVLYIRTLDSDGNPVEKVSAYGQSIEERRFRILKRPVHGRADGEVLRIGSLGAGRYEIMLSQDGTQLGTLRAELGVGEEKTVEFRVPPRLEVSGNVVKNGAPGSGGRITVMDGNYRASGEVDSQGSFVVTVPKIGEYSVYYFERPGISTELQHHTIDRRRRLEVRFRTAPLTVRVLDPEGKPAVGVDGGLLGAGPFNTDSQGRFSFDELVTREYPVHIQHPPPQTFAPRTRLRVGGTVEVTYRLERAVEVGLAIESDVGSVPERVRCSLIDADGEVHPLSPAPGKHRFLWPTRPGLFQVHAQGHAPAVITIEGVQAGQSLEIQLRRSGTIQALLHDGPDGKPLANHPVIVEPLDGIELHERLRHHKTQRNGVVNLSLAPGRYRIRASSPSGEELTKVVEVTLEDEYRRVIVP